MYEILRTLPTGSRVLDVGAHTGSFPPECCESYLVVRLDKQRFPYGDSRSRFVQADAACLPFADASFDTVIANHSLEHMEDLDAVLQEIGRVVRREGAVYVAVPDASTITDRIYRWVYHGGGHVNAFRSAGELASRIGEATGLPLAAAKTLCSSLWFLERDRFEPRPPRRLWLLGNGSYRSIVVINYLLHLFDRLFRARASVYGWAFYFGVVREEIDTVPWTNVCAGCGAAHPAASLIANNRVIRRFLFPGSYHCPHCGSWNLFYGERRA